MLSDEWEWEMGDFGFYEDLDDDGDGINSSSSTSSNTSTASSCSDRIDDPRPATLKSSPPILSSSMIDQISDDGLPWSMQDMKWTRIFASSRDGIAFGTFLRSVRNVSQTIIVASTSDGKVVGGYVEDVWSGRKNVASSREEMNHAFLFVVEPPAAATATMTDDNNKTEQSRFGRFIPGLEEIASSPTGVLEFDFDSLSISSSNNKVDNNTKKEQLHIFKPSPRQASLKQVCQLGNKFISLEDEGHMNFLSIENSFSRGRVTMDSTITEFGVVDFEVYCLSDD